jgi:hypothetical protein
VEELRLSLIGGLSRVALYTASIPVREYGRWLRFFENAHLIHAENVLLSWPCIDGASDEEIRRIIAVARAWSIRVLFRLEAAHMDAFDLKRYEALRTEDTGLYYDPAEIVRLGKRPFHDVLYKCRVKDDVRFFVMHEILYETFEEKVPGHGHCQIKECSSNLLCRSYQGYFSFGNFGPAAAEAVEGFKEMLRHM